FRLAGDLGSDVDPLADHSPVVFHRLEQLHEVRALLADLLDEPAEELARLRILGSIDQPPGEILRGVRGGDVFTEIRTKGVFVEDPVALHTHAAPSIRSD